MTDYPALHELKKEEGSNVDEDGYHVAYQDSLGVWTAGYGRNLQVARFTEMEAERWLREDYEHAATLAEQIPEFSDLTKNRKRVIVAMVYQLGLSGVMKFRNMRMALRHDDFKLAGQEMLDSKWAVQTKSRAKRMAKRMELDFWPN